MRRPLIVLDTVVAIGEEPHTTGSGPATHLTGNNWMEGSHSMVVNKLTYLIARGRNNTLISIATLTPERSGTILDVQNCVQDESSTTVISNSRTLTK